MKKRILLTLPLVNKEFSFSLSHTPTCTSTRVTRKIACRVAVPHKEEMAATLEETLRSLHDQSGASAYNLANGLIADIRQICLHEISEKDRG